MTINRQCMRCLPVMRASFFLLVILNSATLLAQLGGSYTYQYLQLPVSARTAALGGLSLVHQDDDLTIAWYNPAVINSGMHNHLAVNHSIRAGGVNQGYVGYARTLNDSGLTSTVGLMYNSYGQMPMYDINGIQTGNFHASEYALGSGISYASEKLSYGLNLKFLFGQLESYSSMGMAVDLGALFNDTINGFTAGVVLRNLGTQFSAYSPGSREELPFELQAAISKRLAYLPLRITLTGHNLQRFDIRYDDPSVIDNSNIFNADSTAEEKSYLGDKILRHLILSGEIYFGENFRARLGYDYMQQKEMVLTTYRGLSGFSLGFGLQIKKYSIDYAYEVASVAGGNHYFSISTDLDRFLR